VVHYRFHISSPFASAQPVKMMLGAEKWLWKYSHINTLRTFELWNVLQLPDDAQSVNMHQLFGDDCWKPNEGTLMPPSSQQTLPSFRWRQQVPPKCRKLSTRPHSITTVRTSNLTQTNNYVAWPWNFETTPKTSDQTLSSNSFLWDYIKVCTVFTNWDW
jgi:hypothetical protein